MVGRTPWSAAGPLAGLQQPDQIDFVGEARGQSGFSRYAAFCTLPERMQDVHTRRRLVAPLINACTGCKFKFQRRLLTL